MRTPELPALLQSATLHVRRTTGRLVILPTQLLDVEVTDTGEPCLVLARDGIFDGREAALDAGLSWTVARGRATLPVSARPDRREYGDVWLAVATGDAEQTQDRQHFRAEVSLPCRLSWPEDDDVERRDATTVDLSEGGLLALVRGEPPRIGTSVEMSLRIDDEELDGPASVVRHVELPGGTGVAVVFPEPAQHADRLRRTAFEAERRRLRAAR